jgi:DNA gyrase/topoisomerase IV subunit B
MKQHGKWDESQSEDVFNGATVLLAVTLRDPRYKYSTKDQLDAGSAEELVYRMVMQQLPGKVLSPR